MSRGASDPFVERVREATDIVAMIGAEVELKRVGARHRGLCPFHGEKTPSFYVSAEHQSYHCFGCGVSGDAFSFLMAQEKMSFPEALHHLADRAGIAIPDRRGPASDALERIRSALRVARGFYEDRLEAPDGTAAREYLERRGISRETRERYHLGYAPDAWDALLSHARRMLSDRALVEAGLAIEGEKGRIYDRFRQRLMVPIDTASGAPVGFGGRILGEGEPKYLNSPETPVYRKGAVLFGVAEAREGIRQSGRVLVVEGYFDVLSLAQAGINGTVGSCGTALTAEQATLLQRFDTEVVLLFDGDAAGQKAALRALPVVAGIVSRIRVASPPPGLDPDDWVRQAGAAEVLAALEQAPTPLAYLERLSADGILERREALERVIQILEALQDPVHRDLWTVEAAGRFDVRAEAIRERLAQARPRFDRVTDKGVSVPRAPERSTEPPKRSRFEAQCLMAALHWPEWAGALAEGLEEFGDRLIGTTRILRWIESLISGDEVLTPAAILSRAARERPDFHDLHRLVIGESAPPYQPDRLLARIQLRRLEQQVAELRRAIRRAEEAGNGEEVGRLLADLQARKSEETKIRRVAQEAPEPTQDARD